MDETEQGGRDMGSIGNEADLQSRRFEHAPENVIVPIQIARTAIGQVRETGCARLSGLQQDLLWRVGVTETDFDSERDSQRNGGDRAGALGGNGQEHGIRSG